MSVKTKILILFICVILTSCWFPCAPVVSGFVNNNITDTPIDSVMIEVRDGKYSEIIYTDSIGKFGTRLESRSSFILNECDPKFRLIFIKEGFLEKEYTGVAAEQNIQIELEPIDN